MIVRAVGSAAKMKVNAENDEEERVRIRCGLNRGKINNSCGTRRRLVVE